MKTNLDGTIYFDEQGLNLLIESRQRDSVERSVGGLDGTLSVDMGLRKRQLIQSGIIRAASKKTLDENIEAINDLIDGQTHTLTRGSETFENLRIDSFEVEQKKAGGSLVSCDYKIVYTQLGAQ